MKRNAIRLGLAAFATVAATLGPAALAQAKTSHCHPSGSHGIVSDSYARVFGKNGKAYVCIKRNGKTTRLRGADPTSDVFALGGKWVGWSSNDTTDVTSPLHSVVTVMHIPDHYVNAYWYPFYTNQTIARIVVLSDGAAAWGLEADPNDNTTNSYIQGTDRQGHPPDQFSDDLEGSNVVPGSLHVVSGKTIGWSYEDGSTGTQALY